MQQPQCSKKKNLVPQQAKPLALSLLHFFSCRAMLLMIPEKGDSLSVIMSLRIAVHLSITTNISIFIMLNNPLSS